MMRAVREGSEMATRYCNCIPSFLSFARNGWIWTCFQRSIEPFASHEKRDQNHVAFSQCAVRLHEPKRKSGEKAPPIKSPFLVRRCTKNCRATTDRRVSLLPLQRCAAVSTERAATTPTSDRFGPPSYLALCVLCSELDENSLLLG